MSIAPILNNLRIIPRESDFLDRKVGSRGEIFYDRDSNTLRLYNGQSAGGVSLAKSDLSNISNSTFLAKATAAGVGTGGGTGGEGTSISVSAEDSTVNEVTDGIIKFNGLNGIAVTTSATGIVNIVGPNIATRQTAGIVKPGIGLDLSEDGTLNVNGDVTLDAIDSITFSRGVPVREFSNDPSFLDNSSDTVPTESAVRQYIDRRLGYTHEGTTVSSGNTIPVGGEFRYATEEFVNSLIGNFSDLPDATAASLTVDKFYLPAITMLVVTNSGASAYRFDQYGSSDNPTIYAITGMTIAFDLNATGHPFLIQTPSGVNYNTGLIHVTPAGVVTTGAAAQGKDSGTLYWKVPTDISGGYRYQCSVHAPMVGSITVKTINTL
jgi:hypothetical protein